MCVHMVTPSRRTPRLLLTIHALSHHRHTHMHTHDHGFRRLLGRTGPREGSAAPS